MKIAYVIPGVGEANGGTRIVFEHCNRLAARGHQMIVVAQEMNPRQSWFPLSVPIVSIASFREDVDIIVATGASSFPVVKSYQKAKKKWWFLQMRESYFRQLDKRWVDMCENALRDTSIDVWTISRWGKEILEKDCGRSNIQVIGNGLGEDMYYPDPIIDPELKGRKIIVCEGHQNNDAKDKEGWTWRIPIELKKRYPEILLWGYSAGQHQYSKQFDRWLFTPSIQEQRQMYSSAWMMVKASKYDFRAAAPVEAMACGVPTARAVIREDDDMIDNVNCLRCGYDPDKLWNNSLLLLKDEELHDRLSAEGLRYVRKNLQWDDKIDALEKLFRG